MTTLRNAVLAMGLAVFAVAAATPAVAAPFVDIDFEAQANLELVTDQFAADNILFQNVVVVESFITLNEISFPPSSGVHAITGSGPGPAVVEFTSPARLFSAQLTTADVTQVTVFLTDGSTIQSLIDPNLGVGEEFVVNTGTTNIARIEFTSTIVGHDAFFLTLDDVAFSIPEPSAFLIMAAGLVPISAVIRRRARA